MPDSRQIARIIRGFSFSLSTNQAASVRKSSPGSRIVATVGRRKASWHDENSTEAPVFQICLKNEQCWLDVGRSWPILELSARHLPQVARW